MTDIKNYDISGSMTILLETIEARDLILNFLQGLVFVFPNFDNGAVMNQAKVSGIIDAVFLGCYNCLRILVTKE